MSPPTDQTIVHELITYPVTLLPCLAFKNVLLKAFRESGVWGLWATCLFAWPCNKPFSAPNTDVLVCLACTLGTWTSVWWYIHIWEVNVYSMHCDPTFLTGDSGVPKIILGNATWEGSPMYNKQICIPVHFHVPLFPICYSSIHTETFFIWLY